MKTLLKRLTGAFGPSGYEKEIRDMIEREVRPLVDETYTDALGNLYAVRRGSGSRIMLAAHMDQIGLVVTDVDENGFLRIHNVGGVRSQNLQGHTVVFKNGVRGLIGREAREDDPADSTLGRLFVDVGAANREEALKLVQIGDMAVLKSEWAELSGQRVCASALDNRAGCALLIRTLQSLSDCNHEIVAVFTVQEEVGLRGAKAAAYDIAPETALSLDVTPAGDTPKGNALPVKLGEGIAVKIMDRSVICAPGVVEALENAARKAGVRCQREVLAYGGTDSGAIHLSRGGVPSGVLSIPCRYVHSACEVVDLRDMEAGVRLLTAYLERT